MRLVEKVLNFKNVFLKKKKKFHRDFPCGSRIWYRIEYIIHWPKWSWTKKIPFIYIYKRENDIIDLTILCQCFDLYVKKKISFCIYHHRDNIIVYIYMFLHVEQLSSHSINPFPFTHPERSLTLHSIWNEQVTPFWKNDFPRFTLTQSLPAFPFVPFHKYSFVVDT